MAINVEAIFKQMFPTAEFDPESKNPFSDAMRQSIISSTNEAGNPVDQFGSPVDSSTKTGLEKMEKVLLDPNVAAIRPLAQGASRIIYKDGKTEDVSPGDGGKYLYYYSPDISKIDPQGADIDRITFADGTTADALSPRTEATSGNFFESGNWMLPAAIAAATYMIGPAVYSAYATELGIAGGAGAGGGMSAAEAGALGGESFVPGVTGTSLGELGGGTIGAFGGEIGADLALEGAQLGAGSTYGAIETAATQAVGQAAAQAGVQLTPAAQQAATQAVIDAAVAKAGAWGAKEILQAANLAITAATTIGAIADGGDQTTSATTTTQNTGAGNNPFPTGGTGGAAGGTQTGVTPTGTDTTGKTAGAVTFEDFINDFYGLKGGTSAQARGVEDQTALTGYQQTLLDALKNLDATRLTDTKAAVSPYLDQLSNIQGQLSGNTGLGKQVSFGFGGKPMASFVPRPNRELANQVLGMGRESSEINTGLVDMGYKAGVDQAGREFGFNSENLPNKAADTYTAKLMELTKYFNPTGQTSTTTGTVPGTPWYTTALQGLTTGVSLWDKINNPRNSTGVQFKQNADGTFSVVGG